MWVKLVTSLAILRRELKAVSNEYFHCSNKIKLAFITARSLSTSMLNTGLGPKFKMEMVMMSDATQYN